MRKKFLSVIVAVAILLLLPDYGADACDTDLTYKFNAPDLTELTVAVYGSEPVYNEAGYDISTAVRSGISSWNYSGVLYPNITFINSSTYSANSFYSVVVVFYEKESDFAGGCLLYTSDGVRVNPGEGYPGATKDWDYCIIRIHTNNVKVQTESTYPVRALGAHECGHALGLKHCDVKSHSSIMFNSAFEIYHYNDANLSSPTNNDRALLLNLYDVIPNI